jgi:predicted GIY-YIG superfamily endonuclease
LNSATCAFRLTFGVVPAAREKPLKNRHRDWKIRLIEESNPDWSDLSHLP